jgi:hypothetical protein
LTGDPGIVVADGLFPEDAKYALAAANALPRLVAAAQAYVDDWDASPAALKGHPDPPCIAQARAALAELEAT